MKPRIKLLFCTLLITVFAANASAERHRLPGPRDIEPPYHTQPGNRDLPPRYRAPAGTNAVARLA